MPSSIQSMYDVTCLDGGQTYVVQTEGGSHYRLHFIPYDVFPDIPSGCVYVFNIERVVRSSRPDDPQRIRNTVAHVVSKFFADHSNVMLTSCEVDDGMQRGRKRLFDRWFNQMNDGTILTMTARQQTGLGPTDATLYYHRDNIYRFMLEQQFREYIDLMNELN